MGPKPLTELKPKWFGIKDMMEVGQGFFHVMFPNGL